MSSKGRQRREIAVQSSHHASSLRACILCGSEDSLYGYSDKPTGKSYCLCRGCIQETDCGKRVVKELGLPNPDKPAKKSAPPIPEEVDLVERIIGQRFAKLPARVLMDPDLTPGAKLTYAALAWFAWGGPECHPSVRAIVDIRNVSRRSVMREIKELSDKTLITRKKVGRTRVKTTLHA